MLNFNYIQGYTKYYHKMGMLLYKSFCLFSLLPIYILSLRPGSVSAGQSSLSWFSCNPVMKQHGIAVWALQSECLGSNPWYGYLVTLCLSSSTVEQEQCFYLTISQGPRPTVLRHVQHNAHHRINTQQSSCCCFPPSLHCSPFTGHFIASAYLGGGGLNNFFYIL